MTDQLLYQTYLDMKIEFETKESRDRYISRATRELEEKIEQTFNRNILSIPDKQRLKRYGYILFKISTYFYCPTYIKYNIYNNVFIFGLETDYLIIDPLSVPEWQELVITSSLEFNAVSPDLFQMEFQVSDLLYKP